MSSRFASLLVLLALTGCPEENDDNNAGDTDAGVLADAAAAADAATTQSDASTASGDASASTGDASTSLTDAAASTGDASTSLTDAAASTSDAAADAAVEPFLTTALVVRTPNVGGTPTSALDCIATPPEPNYVSSGMDGDTRYLSVRCSILVTGELWTVTFTAFNATSGFDWTDTSCGGSTPPRVLSSVSIRRGGSGFGAGSCSPDYATRVIIDSVDYDARTVSGSVDITLRSASRGAPTYNINGTFSGAWAPPAS